MSFRSTRKYVPDLLVQAKDTDPDLRFMALNDLEKEIENTTSPISYNHLTRYAETILKCLDDEFVEVRTQSLKCFETVGPKLGNSVLILISQLMSKIKKPKKASITSNIYTMALHNLLKNLPCSEGVYMEAIQIIVPEILSDKNAFYLEIDYIEILTDVCEYMGKYLPKETSLEVLLFLGNAAFEADTIISKKSIVTANILLRNITEPHTVSTYVKLLANNYQKHANADDAKIKLLSALSGSISGNPALFQQHVAFLWDTAQECLQLDALEVVDDDYEVQQRKDTVRVEALVLLDRLFAFLVGSDIESLIPQTLQVCESFVTYDPYHENTPDEEGENDDEAYSDYEDDDNDDDYVYEQDDDDDDKDSNSSWKLRVEGLSLLITVLTKFPVKLPLIFESLFSITLKLLLVEKHTVVLSKLVEVISFVFELSSETGAFYNIVRSKELVSASHKRRNSDLSFYTEEDPYAYLSCNSANISETIIQFIQTSNSFVNERPALILSLISNWVSTVSSLDGYVEKFVVVVNEAWKTQLVSTDMFTFYSGLIKNNSLVELGSGLQYLVSYLHKCLCDHSNHRLVNESLTLLTEIYENEQVQSNAILSQLAESFAPLLIKRVRNRNFSTEIRVHSLNTLVMMLLDTEMDTQLNNEIFQMFNETLSTEVLSLNSLNLIVKIVDSSKLLQKIPQAWIKSVLKYCTDYFNISELALSAVKAVSGLFETNLIDAEDCKCALLAIGKLQADSRINEANCTYIGNTLIHVLDYIDVTENLNSFVALLLDLASFDEFDEPLPQLMKKLLNQTNEQNIAGIINNSGNISDLKHSKLLAVLSVTSGNKASIDQMLSNLERNENVYFSLVFLNQVSKIFDIGAGIYPFIAGFGSNDPAIVKITVKLIATLISKFSEKYLEEFICLLAQVQHLAPAFQTLSIVLSDVKLNEEDAKNLLRVIVNIENERGGGTDLESEYKAAAQCLGKLIVEYHLNEVVAELMESAILENQRVLAALAESAKYVFTNFETNETELLDYANLTTVRLIFSSNLKLKEIGISNLNLILTKIPSLAIPLINNNFEELIEKETKPNKEFIHIQSIGPYKHKIDDALNYRKQVFELIYYLLKTLEDNKTFLLLANIDWRLYFNKYFDSGVKDDQSIASVCLLTTLKIFEEQSTIFSEPHGDADVFELFLTRCRKALNKKLSDTAVKQDIEKQNTLVKMIIRFLRKVDCMVITGLLVLTNTQKNLWVSFISDTKSKFPGFDSDE